MLVADGWTLKCVNCGNVLRADPRGFHCPRCGELLELLRSEPVPKAELFPEEEGGGVWKYRKSFPVRPGSPPVTLGEGGTPLAISARLGTSIGLGKVFFKFEGQNPTGSFKDRGMTVAVTRAVESGARVLICASTGNTSASLAAYAARAGLRCAVVLPSGKVAQGKLTQAVAHGAQLIKTPGGFDEALQLAEQAVAEEPWLYLMNSINPYRIEGQKTVAFEIFEQLGGEVPDYVVLPVGNAGNISAVWKGFREIRDSGATRKVPKLIGVQAAGASPIVEAFRKGGKVRRWPRPETEASAIRIGSPVSWRKAIRALEESRGTAVSVTDKEILKARRDLASLEGIFVENASATPLAALRKLKGDIGPDDKVVCVLTGHGLKEEVPVDWALESSQVVRSKKELLALLSR